MTKTSFAMRAEEFIDRARAAVSLQNVGTGYEEAYKCFLEALDNDIEMSPEGIATTEHFIQGLFENRLITEEQWRLHPGYRDVKIERPIVITGIPRSGTTALHKLMSLDPQFQGIELWLAHAPKPRPPRAAWRSDPDYLKMERQLAKMIEAAPELLAEHDMNVDDVDETLMVLQQTFASNALPSQWGIPSYERWWAAHDETPGYQRFADIIRLVGLNDPGRAWLVKNPTDTYSMNAVLNTFPDARVIQTHRDPLQSLPSLVHLTAGAWRMYIGENADVTKLMARETRFWAEAMRAASKARARMREPAFDVEFGSFVQDQMGTVRNIYQHFGLTLKPEVEREMLDWLARKPRRPGALQRHSTEEYGMPAERVREVYADYRTEHGYV